MRKNVGTTNSRMEYQNKIILQAHTYTRIHARAQTNKRIIMIRKRYKNAAMKIYHVLSPAIEHTFYSLIRHSFTFIKYILHMQQEKSDQEKS